jgi:hypothetical protein
VVTLAKVWEVGNAAHVVGLLFGAGIGAWSMWSEWHNLLKFGLGCLFLLSWIPIFWAPWSSDWTSDQGIRAYREGDYAAAIKWYERSRNLGMDSAWCLQNIALSHLAAGHKTQYDATLDTLRRLNPEKAEEVERDVTQTSPEVQESH